MKKIFKKIKYYVNDIFRKNRYVEGRMNGSDANRKQYIQLIVSGSFLLFSVMNILSKSYVMLAFTSIGTFVNLTAFIIAKKRKSGKICSLSSIITCSLLFGCFVIFGGNDGFACLWVVLLPLLSMVVMDFTIGLCTSIFFQIFLTVVFWTPVSDMLLYEYNAQFCLRFPVFYFVTFALGLAITVSLRNSQYNEYIHLDELERMTDAAKKSARTDPLTDLVNRRCAYEEFKQKYSDKGKAHCIVMGDIDNFKNVNDTCGHEFGDEVLVIFSDYIKRFLPRDYLKARWGGEEFLFAANENIDEVYRKVEELRIKMEKHEFRYMNISLHVTCTFGIDAYEGEDDIDEAINKADSRLYKGKRGKKNCTVSNDKIIT